VRKSVGAKIRVGKGLVALASGDFERAGVELGEVGEEGGLGDWEGQVSHSRSLISTVGLINAG
jgi:COP9 signalosome complex subunit 1